MAAVCSDIQKPPTHNSLMFFTSTFPLLDVVEPGSTAVTVMYYCSKLICLICNRLRSLCKINKNTGRVQTSSKQLISLHIVTYTCIAYRLLYDQSPFSFDPK